MDTVAVVCWVEYKHNKQYLNDSTYKPIKYNIKRNQTRTEVVVIVYKTEMVSSEREKNYWLKDMHVPHLFQIAYSIVTYHM